MEFQGKLSEACQKFESLEEDYLTHMTGFMGKLSDIQNVSHSQMGVLYSSFNENIQEFSVNKLLSLFVETKGTGKNKPGTVMIHLLWGCQLSASFPPSSLPLSSPPPSFPPPSPPPSFSPQYPSSSGYFRPLLLPLAPPCLM